MEFAFICLMPTWKKFRKTRFISATSISTPWPISAEFKVKYWAMGCFSSYPSIWNLFRNFFLISFLLCSFSFFVPFVFWFLSLYFVLSLSPFPSICNFYLFHIFLLFFFLFLSLSHARASHLFSRSSYLFFMKTFAVCLFQAMCKLSYSCCMNYLCFSKTKTQADRLIVAPHVVTMHVFICGTTDIYCGSSPSRLWCVVLYKTYFLQPVLRSSCPCQLFCILPRVFYACWRHFDQQAMHDQCFHTASALSWTLTPSSNGVLLMNRLELTSSRSHSSGNTTATK